MSRIRIENLSNDAAETLSETEVSRISGGAFAGVAGLSSNSTGVQRRDGAVSALDYSVWRENYGTTS